MKGIIYFFYYLKNTPKEKFSKFFDKSLEVTKKSKYTIYKDVFLSSLKYKISILDYFYFEFFNKSHEERLKWAGTGFMYEYQLKMNPKVSRNILEDKKQFLDKYKDFIVRSWCSLENYSENENLVQEILNNKSNKIVVKNSKGQVGREVKVLETSKFNLHSLKEYMLENNYDLLEEAVVQHEDLMKLSPSGLNTVRVITQLTAQNEVIILGVRLRVSVNSPVDNLGAGNFAVAVDEISGVVTSNGVFSDITKPDILEHPVTKVRLKGLKLPNWDLVITTVIEAAKKHPQNKSIGWDVAITESQVDLIEGNHNWCKLLYQLPVKKGLKQDILKYYS